jgi:hypothetical protein
VLALCNRAAAFTGAELALKEGVRVTQHYPTRGVLRCFSVGTSNGASQRLGSARQAWPELPKQKSQRGALNFDFIFGDAGGRFLALNTTAGIQINWSCTWTPRGGAAQTSTTSMITSH